MQNGIIASHKTLSNKSLLLRPRATLGITSDTNLLKIKYQNIGKLYQADLPAFNDDNGCVLLLNENGKIMDRNMAIIELMEG